VNLAEKKVTDRERQGTGETVRTGIPLLGQTASLKNLASSLENQGALLETLLRSTLGEGEIREAAFKYSPIDGEGTHRTQSQKKSRLEAC